jgi:hypothetical protein
VKKELGVSEFCGRWVREVEAIFREDTEVWAGKNRKVLSRRGGLGEIMRARGWCREVWLEVFEIVGKRFFRCKDEFLKGIIAFILSDNFCGGCIFDLYDLCISSEFLLLLEILSLGLKTFNYSYYIFSYLSGCRLQNFSQ